MDTVYTFSPLNKCCEFVTFSSLQENTQLKGAKTYCILELQRLPIHTESEDLKSDSIYSSRVWETVHIMADQETERVAGTLKGSPHNDTLQSCLLKAPQLSKIVLPPGNKNSKYSPAGDILGLNCKKVFLYCPISMPPTLQSSWQLIFLLRSRNLSCFDHQTCRSWLILCLPPEETGIHAIIYSHRYFFEMCLHLHSGGFRASATPQDILLYLMLLTSSRMMLHCLHAALNTSFQ